MKRRLLILFLACVTAFSLAACGGSSKASDSNSASSADFAPEDMMEQELGFDAGGASSGGAAYPNGQKLIRTAQMELETTAFEETVQSLTELTERMGGYFESNSVQKRSGGRWADFTVRIPAQQYQTFLEQAGGLCHEIWRSAQQDDISQQYYDTQGRLKTQQIKLERLQALLAKAEKMEDIITIESAISETEQSIDDLSGTMRYYDGQVDYATVSITLNEVYKLSNVEEVPDSFAARIARAFGSGWDSFTGGMENLAVGLAYSWMWIVAAAAVGTVVFRVVRRRRGGWKKPGEKADKS